jgi:hypothetical protein
MDTNNIINNIKSDIECDICYEKFIKLKSKQYYKFLEDNENLLPVTFEDYTCCLLYEDRFECLICKSKVICRKCYWNFKNHNFKPEGDDLEEYEYCNELDDNGLSEGCPGEDCPIICPFCRTKDYKIFYGNQIPYDLLSDIKNQRLKCKKV